MTITLRWAVAPVPLRFTVSLPSPGAVRLAVAGEVDLATAPMLGMRLLTVMDTLHPTIIDLDLAKVAFLDCAGIGVLVAVRNTADNVGCQLWISHPQPLVARMLEIVGPLALCAAPIVPPSRRSTASWATRSRVLRRARDMVGRIAA